MSTNPRKSLISLFFLTLALAVTTATGGVVDPSGWARARINDGADLQNNRFIYPENSTAVRLYLIDSAVDNSSAWFSGNPNLTLSAPIFTGPSHVVPAISGHASKMLGIIAGPTTGVALGTQLEVINYNITTPVGVPSLAYAATALFEAVAHFEQNPVPSIVCLAIGVQTLGFDYYFEYALQRAVDAGITVVVSAGNSSGSASDYLPARMGTTDGVICIGGSRPDNSRLPMSDQGGAVDMYAPGENVLTFDPGNPSVGGTYPMSGTSASTAIAAGVALSELARNPELTPAELEAYLKSLCFSAPGLEILQMGPVFDIDGDGAYNVVENFFGTDAESAGDVPSSPRAMCENEALCLHFSINEALFDPSNPYILTDGTQWKVLLSGNYETWALAPGLLTHEPAVNGKVPVTFSVTTGHPKTFLRLEIASDDPADAPVALGSLAQALHGADWEDTVTNDGAEFQAVLVMNSQGVVELELIPIAAPSN